jgi:histidinol-phosphate aminotransferase
MGLLDYYRQFDDMSESEFNQTLRERRAREKALALEIVPVLDLSGTEWPEYPSAEVVQASVFTARGRINGYPDVHATRLRRALAERHGIKADQIVVGNGSAELLQTAAYLLLTSGDVLVTPWPSYSRYPTIALRAGASPVSVDLADGAVDPDTLAGAVTPRTRVITLCNPNDPTGTYLESDTVGSLLSRLPEHVHVLLDEAYIQFQDVEEEDACMGLVEAVPRLLVVRSFSKAYGLSGLRAGYVVGSAASTSLLSALAPVMGVNVLTQAAILQALKVGDSDIAGRCKMVVEQRGRLQAALGELPVTSPPSQANFIWLRADALRGAELVERLERARVRVAAGGPLGEEDHVRAAIGNSAATDRLLWALRQALEVPQDGRRSASP